VDGRFHGTAGQLPGVEPIALQLQRQPLTAQTRSASSARPQPRAAFARVGAGIEEQVRPVLWRSHADRDSKGGKIFWPRPSTRVEPYGLPLGPRGSLYAPQTPSRRCAMTLRATLDSRRSRR
jgi:hypothetical protein